MEGHELYCAGAPDGSRLAHISHGKSSLLNIARRFADLIDLTFGKESSVAIRVIQKLSWH